MPGKRAARTAKTAFCGASRACALRPGFCGFLCLSIAADGKTENTSGSPRRQAIKTGKWKPDMQLRCPRTGEGTASFFLVHLIFLLVWISYENIEQAKARQRPHNNANNKRYHSNFPFYKKPGAASSKQRKTVTFYLSQSSSLCDENILSNYRRRCKKKRRY